MTRGFGGYVNLEAFGILTQSEYQWRHGWLLRLSRLVNLFNYYGDEYAGMSFTDDGFAIFDLGNANYGGSPWSAQAYSKCRPAQQCPAGILA